MKRNARLPMDSNASRNPTPASRSLCAEVGRIGDRPVFVVYGDRGLRAIAFDAAEVADLERTGAPPAAIAAPIARYLAGEVETFADVPLDLEGTAFQRKVWLELQRVPYGHVASYGAIAARIGVPRAVRAVGAANGRNPIPIVIPCHRVVEAEGGLGGYSGGLDVKRALLRLEGARLEGGRVRAGQLAFFA